MAKIYITMITTANARLLTSILFEKKMVFHQYYTDDWFECSPLQYENRQRNKFYISYPAGFVLCRNMEPEVTSEFITSALLIRYY